MSANIIFVHDDPEFLEEAGAALRLAGHKVNTFREPMEALCALEAASFEILITRARFPIGQPNGVALARMSRIKHPSIRLVFTVAAEYAEYAEEFGETLTAPIDIPELVAVVARVASA